MNLIYYSIVKPLNDLFVHKALLKIMKFKPSSKKFFLRPGSLILIFLVLAVLMISSALIELDQSKKELLDLMEEQAHTLLETVLISSNNALLTYEHLEIFLEERLLNNAGFIKYLYEKNEISNSFLEEFTRDNNIYRINIIGIDGTKKYSSHQAKDHEGSGTTNPNQTLKPLFDGIQDTLIIGYKQANFEQGMRYAIALATNDRSAIVLNLDAEELLNFRRRIGFGSLLKEMTGNPSIVYIALQDSSGIIAASGNVRELDRIEDSPYLSNVMRDSTFLIQLIQFEDQEIFEAVHPFYYDGIPVGLFRLGLSAEPLNQIKNRIYRRIVIISLILVGIGFIVFTFILVRLNYGLLLRQYQTVETYSSNIIQNVSDAIVVIDEKKRIKVFNQAAENIFQVKGGEVTGSVFGKILLGQDCENKLLSSSQMEQVECQVQQQNKTLLVSKSKYIDEDNSVNTVLVIRDLTEQKKLEAQIQRKERLFAMGELASGVAHEIRNPLNAIGTIVQQLDKDFEPKNNNVEYHQLAKIVVKEVFRINETIQDFLRFSRPEPIVTESFYLDKFFKYIRQQYQPMLDEHKIQLTLLLKWKGEVSWDRRQMQQVFVNLIQNAIDAMPDTGKLSIAVEKLEGDEMEISVADTGAGISENIQSNIFNLYFTTKAKGTGIGLSIVQRIIYEHGGVISVESRQGEGTVFLIRMPIKVHISGQ
jgi:two-component system, NtrC family, sensor histidine kinase HydH